MPLKGIEGLKFKDDLRWICPVHPAWCRNIYFMERCERQERLWRHVTMIGKHFLRLKEICLKEICNFIHTSVACAIFAQVLPRPQLIFPSKTWIFGISSKIFSGRNHLKINISHILNPNLTKSILLNPAHQDLSNNTKGTFQFLRNFQLQFQWRSPSMFKNFCTTSPKAMEPSPCTPSRWAPCWELSKDTKNTI